VDVPAFLAAQLAGGISAVIVSDWLGMPPSEARIEP